MSTILQLTKCFEVGKTYTTRSACDHECIFAFEIVARTAKTITFTYHGKTIKRGVYLWDGMEACFPMGKYSMAPIIRADDAVKEEAVQIPGPVPEYTKEDAEVYGDYTSFLVAHNCD